MPAASADFGVTKWEAGTCREGLGECTYSSSASRFYATAAGHPEEGLTDFAFALDALGLFPQGEGVKDVRVDLPEGLNVDPQAVAREVFEEAGVRVRDVSYIASQPWPFPSQLMIACHAHADDDALTLDPTELEDAQWFTRQEVIEAFENPDAARFAPPFPLAVAHHMLRWWLEKSDG